MPQGVMPCGIFVDRDGVFGELPCVPNPRREAPFAEGDLERIAGI